MLCLKRKIRGDGTIDDRRIFIGDDVIITLISVDRNNVLIGISAPSDVLVVREELMSPSQITKVEKAARGE